MQVYHLNDDCGDPDSGGPEFLWIVTDYEAGSYDGSGDAVGLTVDGKLYTTSLGHCSCFGPWEAGWDQHSSASWNEITRDQLLDESAVGGLRLSGRLEQKVLELLREPVRGVAAGL